MPKATNKGGDFAPVPAGVQHAICYQVIDIGTQPSVGNFPARRKAMIVWELPNERNELDRDGRPTNLPRAIHKDYTLSTDKKANLTKDLESWRGRGFTPEEAKEFELSKILGANCQINVIHKPKADGSRIYANVGSIMPLAKGVAKLAPENPMNVFDIPEHGPITFPDWMPEWIQNKIKNSEEYLDRVNGRKAEPLQTMPGDPVDEADPSVPF